MARARHGCAVERGRLALFDMALMQRARRVLVPMRAGSRSLQRSAEQGPDTPLLQGLVAGLKSRRVRGAARRARCSAALGWAAGSGAAGGAAAELVCGASRDGVGACDRERGPGQATVAGAGARLADGGGAAQRLRRRAATRCRRRWCSTIRRRGRSRSCCSSELLRSSGGARRDARVHDAAARSDEPIAIVAMAAAFLVGCGYAGGAVGAAGRGARRDRGRSADALGRGGAVRPGPGRGGQDAMRVRAASCEDVEQFDAAFFGISPREALAMDPQQRLLLETAWEALERAGIAPASLRGQRDGRVRRHRCASDYAHAAATLRGAGGLPRHGQREERGVGPDRVHAGPAGPGDDGRHGVLVVAGGAAPGVQALRQGECDLALAGGVTVMPTPATFVEFSRQRGLAPDGRCKAFSAAADGTGWARAAGCWCWSACPMRGATGIGCWRWCAARAVNQDGRSQGSDGAERSVAAAGDPAGAGATRG